VRAFGRAGVLSLVRGRERDACAWNSLSLFLSLFLTLSLSLSISLFLPLSLSLSLYLTGAQGADNLFIGQRENERERERERERDKGIEKEKVGERDNFFKGMTGALAPFSYLVV
jgi:hypothetical protein